MKKKAQLEGCSPCDVLGGCNPLSGGCDPSIIITQPVQCVTQIPDCLNQCFACLPQPGFVSQIVSWGTVGISSLIMLAIGSTLTSSVFLSAILVVGILIALMFRMR
jgi:hypothetical protein